jgi:hypothetical protein
MVHGTGSTSITAASPEWIPLSSVYHYVLARSPSPEFAKIAISTAWENNQLRLRAEVREREDRPGLSLRPGGQVPEIPPKCKPDQLIFSSERIDLDWERCYGSRRHAKSHFEYVAIVVNRDDVLKVWPPVEMTVMTEASKTTETPSAKPADVSDFVWAIVQILDAIEKEDRIKFAGLTQEQLAAEIKKRLGRGSLRTVQKAVAARRRRDQPH